MLAIPTPKLWQPRSGPWWRMPSVLSMAHLKKGASGHLLKTSTGHLSKGCGGYTTCCDISDGSTWTITTASSGVDSSTCIVPTTTHPAGVNSLKCTTSLDATDSRILLSPDVTADSCYWFWLPGKTFSNYSDSSCASFTSLSNYVDYGLYFYKTGANVGRFELLISQQMPDDSFTWLMASGLSDSSYSVGDCDGGTITEIEFTSMTANYSGASAPVVVMTK